MNSKHIVIYDLFMLIKFILFKMILFSYNPLKLGLWVHFSKKQLIYVRSNMADRFLYEKKAPKRPF